MITTATNSFRTAEANLGWSEARTGREEGVQRLRELESRRLEQFAAGQIGMVELNDLRVIASVLHDEDEQLRWWREAVSRVLPRFGGRLS
jgi:hypothetical protein